MPLELVYVPVLVVAKTKAYPVGNKSKTETPVALLGPLFVAVIVKLTVESTQGESISTVLVIDTSAQIVTGTGADCAAAPHDKVDETE